MTTPEIKSISQLKILQGGRIAGRLSRTQHGASFEYDASYLADSATRGIAFHMAKRSTPYDIVGSNLHPFFAGLLPEGLRFKTLVRGLKTSEDDLFSILATQGSACVGDVCPEVLYPQVAALPQKLKDTNFTEYFKELLNSPIERGMGHDTFAGVQNKISASMISFPVNIAKKTYAYLLKLNSDDYPNIVHNEYACLRMAAKCGLAVAKATIVKDNAHEPGLLVKRFDRAWNDEKQLLEQVHMEDACQFLNLYPSEKYRVDLADINKGLHEWCSAPALDLLTLLEQYAFSYLICNGDMHAKNVSLLRDPISERIALSPAYDIVCTLPYGDRKMAIKIDGREDNIKAKTLIDFGVRHGVAEMVLQNRIKKITTKFAKYLPLFIEDMAPALDSDKKIKDVTATLQKRLEDLS